MQISVSIYKHGGRGSNFTPFLYKTVFWAGFILHHDMEGVHFENFYFFCIGSCNTLIINFHLFCWSMGWIKPNPLSCTNSRCALTAHVRMTCRFELSGLKNPMYLGKTDPGSWNWLSLGLIFVLISPRLSWLKTIFHMKFIQVLNFSPLENYGVHKSVIHF